MQHRWLEEELARRYRDAAPATLALLQERCEGVAAELVAAESRLQAAEDVTSLRRAGVQPYSLMQLEHVTLSAASSAPVSLPFAAFHARCLSFHHEHLLCCSSTQPSMMTPLLLSLLVSIVQYCQLLAMSVLCCSNAACVCDGKPCHSLAEWRHRP